jgi:hypothetical protein
MLSAVWLPPLVRAVATAALVVTASAIAEALGPFWGGLIAGLPVSSGPAYVFLAMQHGDRFIAASALASFAANAATALFLVIYGRLARRSGLALSLGTALTAWFAAALLIRAIPWSPGGALVLNLALYGVGFLLLPTTSGPTAGQTLPASRRRSWAELPLRAAAVAAFVTSVVGVSTLLGPSATGMLAVFPVSLTSLIVILHPRIGGAAAARMVASALRAMLGFGLMLLALRFAVPFCGRWAALALALLVSALWSAGMVAARLRPRAA